MSFPTVTYSCILADGTYVLEFSLDQKSKNHSKNLSIKEYSGSTVISSRSMALAEHDTEAVLCGLAMSRIHPGNFDLVFNETAFNEQENDALYQKGKELIAASYINECGEFKTKLSYWLVEKGSGAFGIEICSATSSTTEISREYILFDDRQKAVDFINRCARNFVFPYSLEEIIYDMGLKVFSASYQ